MAELNIDTFGEIMDDVIHKSKIGMVVTKEENSDEWNVETSAGCGAVMDFFVGMNALGALYGKMLEELKKVGEFDEDGLVEGITGMIRNGLRRIGKDDDDEERDEDPGEPDGRGGRE